MDRSRPVSIGEPDKVTAWPFKEPEKKSAWKDEPPRDVSIRMVDQDTLTSERLTALLKERMAPPGALRLPPLLEAARLRWGIPDGAFKCQAIFDRIHIFPIDLWDEPDYVPGTTILRTSTSKQRDEQNGHRGVLLSMGLTAADQCVSHGVELGHIVRTIRNAPHAQECDRLGGTKPIYYLVMRAGDLTGSETQREQLLSGETKIVDEGGDHGYSFNLEGKKKRVALVQDNW